MLGSAVPSGFAVQFNIKQQSSRMESYRDVTLADGCVLWGAVAAP